MCANADVSFAEIFNKSVDGFTDSNFGDDASYRYATLAFFGGFVIVFILDRFVHLIVEWIASRKGEDADGISCSHSQAVLLWNEMGNEKPEKKNKWKFWKKTTGSGTPDVEAICNSPRLRSRSAANAAAAAAAVETASPHDDAGFEISGSRLPVTPEVGSPTAAAKRSEDAFVFIVEGYDGVTYRDDAPPEHDNRIRTDSGKEMGQSANDTDEEAGNDNNLDKPDAIPSSSTTPANVTREQPSVMDVINSDPHHRALHKMGLLTALAICLHNFPEGLATFVATLSDAKVGVGIAIAIAMHNIPEGICVALPIYYATGSRWKAFSWALLSGMSEPLGALVGWLALYGDNSLAYAIIFALVGGMMVYISVKELIPMALRYDPKDSIASTCVVLGMIVMAVSLILFTL